MNLLLDTHVMIWLVTSPNLLSKAIKNLIVKDDTILHTSTVSYWELSIKYGLGKIDLKEYTPVMIKDELINQVQVKIMELGIEDTATFYQLNGNYHRDPFDRMLIWQAIRNNYIFITDDTNIKKYMSEGLKVLW